MSSNSGNPLVTTIVLASLFLTACERRPATGVDGARSDQASRSHRTDAPIEDEVFTRPIVLNIDIEVPRAGMSALRRTQWGGGGGDERPVAKATVREAGVVYNNVAVHLKGAAGSFRPVDDHPALTLNFDKFEPDQSFHGLHKISLNNSVQDPSYLSEKICRELFIAAGVPVPRAGYAMVKLNGRNLGLYVLLEGANKQFLKQYFRNTKGNLYDGGFVRDIDEGLAVNSGDDPGNRSALQALVKVASHEGKTNLVSLERVLDVDRFLSMMAMEALVCHWDGYVMNKNNWRVFHDLDSDSMVFIPHGLDQTFGVGAGRRGRNEANIVPPASGMVAAAILRSRDGRSRYLKRFNQLYTNVFKVDAVLTRVDQIEAALLPALAQQDPQAAHFQEQQAAGFKRRVVLRHQAIMRQLGAAPTAPVRFGSDGVLALSGWRPYTGTGNPLLRQMREQERTFLSISTRDGNCSASWRTRILLPPGQYRFEGKVRLQGVSPQEGDRRAGVGLRISRGTMPEKWMGTEDWKEYVYTFDVDEQEADVELVCELRALQGEARFDVSTLRLVRIP